MTRQRLLLLAFLTAVTAACFSYYAAADCLRNRVICFGTGGSEPIPAPFRYRVLEPALNRLLNPSGSQEGAVVAAIVLFSVLTALTLPLLYIWLNRWMNSDRAMLGVMVYALVNIAAFHFMYISLGVSIEAACVVLALVFIERTWVFLPLVVLASLNRETGVVLVGIYAAYHWRTGAWGVLILAGIYAGITAGLHIVLGNAPHVLGFTGTLAYNAENITDGVITNLILLPLYILAIQGYRHAPAQLKRLAWVAGVYTLAVAVGGVWGEAQRLILPVLPIMLPLIFCEYSRRWQGARDTNPSHLTTPTGGR